jgi:tetratricopeptide (TPR) repeat protein
MNSERSNNDKRNKKSRVYAIIGIVILAIMGIAWSLDASLDYILFGAAAFFFFLYFWNKPGTPAAASGPQKQNASSLKPWFSGTIKNKRQANQGEKPKTSRPAALMVFIFFGLFFFVFMSSLFFSDDSVSEAETYFQRAEQFRWNSQYDSADYHYGRAISIQPEYAEALNGYGLSLRDQKRNDQALATFDKAIVADPDYEEARYNKSVTYYAMKNYRQSLKESFALLRQNPAYYSAMTVAGDDYYADQRYDSAIYWYGQAYDNGERSAWLCHVLGYLHESKNKQDEAILFYQEALSYDSINLQVYDRLGVLLPGSDGEGYRLTAQQLRQAGYSIQE